MQTENQILQFEKTGHLRAGIHDCDWQILLQLTLTNPHRRNLGTKLLSFLRWPFSMGVFPRIYMGGGFISNQAFPQDIDLILETQYPFGPEAFSAMEPFFSKGLDKILAVYSVHLHFWIKDGPPSLIDYRSFFQYQRPEKARCLDTKRRGIVRLSLLPEDWVEILALSHGVDWNGELNENVVDLENLSDLYNEPYRRTA